MSSRCVVANLVSTMNVALNSHFSSVSVSRSRLVLNIIELLYINGFIRGFSIQGKDILIYLKYQNSKSVISEFKIVSRPVNLLLEI